MPVLSYVHQLFDVDQCQTYIHTLRWQDRPLQCPRCQSQDVDPWGSTTTDPGANATGVTAASAPSTISPTPCSSRASGRSRSGCWRPFCCVSPARRDALPGRWGSIAARAIAGAGGSGMPRCPMRCIVNWQARSKPMTSLTRRARRGKRHTAGRKRWDAARGAPQAARARSRALRQRPAGHRSPG